MDPSVSPFSHWIDAPTQPSVWQSISFSFWDCYHSKYHPLRHPNTSLQYSDAQCRIATSHRRSSHRGMVRQSIHSRIGHSELYRQSPADYSDAMASIPKKIIDETT